MKIIFFGTPVFASNNLQYLINKGIEIVAVVTSIDRNSGRGKKIKYSAVKETAIINNIPVLQPEKLKSDNFLNDLKNYNARLFIVVAFRMLPESVWNIPKYGTINLHTSLLPNYKGAAPINHVLINGEKKTGITTFFINHEIDSGQIIQQKMLQLTDKTTAAQLHQTFIKEGNYLLINTINQILDESIIKKTLQNKRKLQFAPKLTKKLLKINWETKAQVIHNLVRGLSPFIDDQNLLMNNPIFPSAWFLLESENGIKKRVKIHQTEVIKSDSNLFLDINTDNKTYLHITTRKNLISILNIQIEGKKPMTIKQFLQGTKFNEYSKIS